MNLGNVIKIKEEEKRLNLQKLFDDLKYLEKNPNKEIILPPVDLKNLQEKKRVHEGIADIYGELYDSLNFNQILIDSKYNKILKEIVLARIQNPKSKLKTCEIFDKDCNKSIDVNSVYRMMDLVEKNETNILKTAYAATISLFEEKIDILFFDVTTIYYESTNQDEVKGFGFSKDHKFGQVQVVLALATTHEGLPVGYKIFKGNTAEVKTLLACLNEWKAQFPIENVIFVADRAMFCAENLYELEKSGHKFIVAAKLRVLSQEKKSMILNDSHYTGALVGGDFIWKKEISHIMFYEEKIETNAKIKKISHEVKGRLICTYSTKRANKDIKDRERFLYKINNQLSAKDKKVDVKKIVTNAILKKFCKFEGKTAVSLDDNKVTEDANWDGMHGIFTNSDKDVNEIIERYKGLWQIEETFRITKTDLKIRPIYHFTPRRIRAHVAICFISLCLIRQLQVRMKRAKLTYSMQRIQEELNRIQYSICKDNYTGITYRIPSAMNEVARDIYRILKIKRDNKVSIYSMN